jgi:hypothetical protein
MQQARAAVHIAADRLWLPPACHERDTIQAREATVGNPTSAVDRSREGGNAWGAIEPAIGPDGAHSNSIRHSPETAQVRIHCLWLSGVAAVSYC